ncbi:PAS domain-containing protein [Thalassobaculum salexigens]|uniref:PAS domain-containing protein n=1 Tax=Thalassobaculum salexigens TaxID=455360 RepID=UPI0003F4BBB6|nr:PAS domain-containing protein [Thalassobaculum salexigens]
MQHPSPPDASRFADALLALCRQRLRYQPTFAIAELWADSLLKAPPGGLPGFDPLDAAPMLPHIYILEREGDALRYRVSGESVNELFGSSHTGKLLSEVVPPGIYSLVAPYFREVFALKACIFKGHVIHSGHSAAEFERLLLPVRRNETLQLLGVLSLSTTSRLRTDDAAPAPVENGFHFTQIGLSDGTVTETHIPLRDLPVEDLPFKEHVRLLGHREITQGVSQKDSETVC